VDTWIVTGGAGFVGANLVRALRAAKRVRVVTLDLLTYAGDRERLAELADDCDHVFVEGDVADAGLVRRLLDEHRPRAVLHLAAETHVDRSIDGPVEFMRVNTEGTLHLLLAVCGWWQTLPPAERAAFRFLHAGTDEVFGALGPTGRFTEASPYAPRSPYSASKAGADHLVRAWHATFGLPTLLTNGSNIYGPWQLPEKLIPLLLLKALAGEPLPIYGDGGQVRDWMHVEDHVAALVRVVERGAPGASYLLGGGGERTNLELARALCGCLDTLRPTGAPHARLIRHVPDRPGHDRRYAVDPGRLTDELAFEPRRSFDEGLRSCVAWMLEHRGWLEAMTRREGVGTRLGLSAAPRAGGHA
jgi:dTDP-glucose 4,6-dehydratase